MRNNAEKKPLYKRWWIWAIVVFIVVGALGSASTSNDKPGTTDSSMEQTETSKAVSEPAATEPEATEETEPPETAGWSEVQTPEAPEVPATEPSSEYVPAPADNDSEESTEAPSEDATEAPTDSPEVYSYVINTGTGKFHTSGCKDVDKISAENRWDYEGTRESVLEMGYSPCGHCHP